MAFHISSQASRGFGALHAEAWHSEGDKGSEPEPPSGQTYLVGIDQT